MIASFFVYLAVLLFIGIITYRLTKTLDDFILAGRKLGTWVVAISAKASDLSGWLILGVPGKGYNLGIGAMWAGIAVMVGTFFNWAALSKRLRRYTEILNALTIPDFLEARFRDEKAHILRLISAIAIVIFMTAYLSAQFVASGKVIAATFGMDYYFAMILGACVILFYTIMGGFFAVAWTDLLQGLLMLFAVVVLPIVGLAKLGGFGSLGSAMAATDISLVSIAAGKSGWQMWSFIIGMLAIGLGYPGQPHILARYMAIKEPKKLRQGTLISMIWVIIVMYGAILIGIVGRQILTGVSDPERIMPLLAMKLLPGWLAGILIAAAMAAIMSTADSQLLVATSAIAEDFYHKLIGKNASQKTLVMISRIATLVIGLIAILLARPGGVVFSLVLYAWGGLAASFGPAVIMSLYWKKATKTGIAAGMLAGMLTIVIWHNISVLSNFLYELVPGFFVSLGVIYLVSLMTKAPENIDEDFERMKHPLASEI